MKMKVIVEKVHDYEVSTIEQLIEKLGAIRANSNGDVEVEFTGDREFGHALKLSWERPLTEEEQQQYERDRNRAQEAAKEARRHQYETLKAEFGEQEAN